MKVKCNCWECIYNKNGICSTDECQELNNILKENQNILRNLKEG